MFEVQKRAPPQATIYIHILKIGRLEFAEKEKYQAREKSSEILYYYLTEIPAIGTRELVPKHTWIEIGGDLSFRS